MPAADLLGAAERRWQQILVERPETAPALPLHRRLISRQVALVRDEHVSAAAAADRPEPLAVAGLLLAHKPAFAQETIAAPPLVVREALLAFLDDLLETPAAEAAAKIGRALEPDEVDRVLRASELRDAAAIDAIGRGHGLNLQVLWLVAELASAPLAHLRQRELLDSAHESMLAALEGWDEGWCPACGSWPVLAEFFHGTRVSRCSYCAGSWTLREDRCTFCGEAGAAFRTIVPDRERPGRRLELCRTCRGYLKTIDVGVPTPFPLLAVEDFATSDLDAAALHHGFRRTPLRPLRSAGL